MSRKRKENTSQPPLMIGLRGEALDYLLAIKRNIKEQTGVVAPNTAIILAALKQMYSPK